MNKTDIEKIYQEPKVQLIRQDEHNEVFFAASGPSLTSTGGAQNYSIGAWTI